MSTVQRLVLASGLLVSAVSGLAQAVSFDPGWCNGPSVAWAGGAFNVNVACSGNEEYAGMLTAAWNPTVAFTNDPYVALVDSSGATVKAVTLTGATNDWYARASRSAVLDFGMVAAGSYTLKGRNGARQISVSGEGWSGFSLKFTSILPPPPPSTYALTLNFSGDGQGSVVVTPDGASFTASTTVMYAAGALVRLDASPAVNSIWGGFNGGDKAVATITVEMNSPRTVYARFDQQHVANNRPTISWGPTPGTVSSGATYTISAHATDDGNLASMVILRNGTPVALTTNSVGRLSGDVSYTTSDTNSGSTETTITYSAYATDAEGARSATISQTVTIAPPSPVDATINANVTGATAPGAATVSWTTTNALTATIRGPNVFTSSAMNASQSFTGLASGNYTCTITANGAGGATVTRSTSFSIAAGADVSADITATPSSVREGGSAVIDWNSANASSVSVTGSGGFSSTLPASSLSLSNLSPGTYSYTITAQGQGGPATKTATVTVTRRDAVTAWISLSPASANAPASTTVSWGSTNATDVTVSTTAYGGSTLSNDLSGSEGCANIPAGTYSFTITASGPNGTDTKSATLVVGSSSGGSGSTSRALWMTFDKLQYPCTGATAWITIKTSIPGPGRIRICRMDSVRWISDYDDEGNPIYVTTENPVEIYSTPVNLVDGPVMSFQLPATADGQAVHYKGFADGTDQYLGSTSADAYVLGIPPPQRQTVTITPVSYAGSPGDTVSLTAAGGHTGYVWSGATTSNAERATFVIPTGAQLGDTYTVSVYSPAGGPIDASWAASNFAQATINIGTVASGAGVKVAVFADPITLPWKGGDLTVQGSVLFSNPPTNPSTMVEVRDQQVQSPYFDQKLGPIPHGVAPANAPISTSHVALPPNVSTNPRNFYVTVSGGSPQTGTQTASKVVTVAPIPTTEKPIVNVGPVPDLYWDGTTLWQPNGPNAFTWVGSWPISVYSPGSTAQVSATVTFANGNPNPVSYQNNGQTTQLPLSGWPALNDRWTNINGAFTSGQLSNPPIGPYVVTVKATSPNGTTTVSANANVYWKASVSAWFTAPPSGTGEDPETGDTYDLYPTDYGWSFSPNGWQGALGKTVTMTVVPGNGGDYPGSGGYKFDHWEDDAGNVLSRALAVTYTTTKFNDTLHAVLVLGGTPTAVSFDASPLTFVYDGQPKSPAITATPAVSYVSSGTATASNVGTYTVAAAAASNTNYSGSKTFTWTITPKPVTFEFSNLTQVYDGSPKPVAVTPSAAAAPYAVTYTGANGTSYGPSTTAPSASGTYAVTAATTDANYTGSSAATLVVSTPVTFEFSDLTWTYDGLPKSATITPSNPAATFTVTYTGTNGSAYGPASAGPTNVGAYLVTATTSGAFSGGGSATLLIGKATPVIVWPTPAPVTYGTALSATQLNATAFVPGSFAYTPAAGAVPGAGTQSLSVKFTPTDSNNFVTATKSVSLTVNPARLIVTADNKTRAYGAPNPPLTYTTTGFVNGESETVVNGAADISTTATMTSDVGNYPVNVAAGSLAAANYTFEFRNGSLAIFGRPVTFTFSNLLHTYDGTIKSATVTPSEPSVAYSAVLSGGPDVGTYVVSATASHGWTGTSTANLVIAPAPQTVSLAPATATIFAGQPVTLSATGGHNAYAWGGDAGASGSADSVTLTLMAPGTYTVSVSNAASRNYLASNTATARLEIVPNRQVTSLTPVPSNYTVSDASNPLNGQTYRRLWQAGSWTAYLGRPGVRFSATVQAWPSIQAIELQARAPGANWTQLAVNRPGGAQTSLDSVFSVQLGESAPGQPLVPLSFLQGTPQTGSWAFRARVQDANGAWSEFSPEVAVNVILPIATQTISGQTVPPAGELGNWFTASRVQEFPVQFWIP